MANEKRLIDLNSVIEQLENEWGYEGIREDLYKLPTVDAAPVVHGRWKEGYLIHKYGCSCCGARQDRISPYCPNCGAKMDGGNENA